MRPLKLSNHQLCVHKSFHDWCRENVKKSILQYGEVVQYGWYNFSFLIKKQTYRRSSVSAVFGCQANCTIGKCALIGYRFSTKIAIWDFWIFKAPFFLIISMKFQWFIGNTYFDMFIELTITNFDFFEFYEQFNFNC